MKDCMSRWLRAPIRCSYVRPSSNVAICHSQKESHLISMPTKQSQLEYERCLISQYPSLRLDMCRVKQ